MSTSTAFADSPCGGLTAGSSGSKHDIEHQATSGITATRANLRAYNPFVINQNGSTGFSTAWVMLTKANNLTKWAQTGWLKSPMFGSDNPYNPLLYFQVSDGINLVTVFREPDVVVTPPYSHSYQVTTDRAGEFSFDFNGEKWATLTPSNPASWSLPSAQRHGGEIFQWHSTSQNRGDQMAGDRINGSKMTFRAVNWSDNFDGDWSGSELAHVLPTGRPWFKYYHINGSNFDIWDERCPN